MQRLIKAIEAKGAFIHSFGARFWAILRLPLRLIKSSLTERVRMGFRPLCLRNTIHLQPQQSIIHHQREADKGAARVLMTGR
jgi:hypothetical protein